MTKPLEAHWEEPTLTEAFIDGATGRIPGTRAWNLRSLVLACVAIAALGWAMPSIIETGPRILVSGLIASMFAGWTAWRMQSRFGRSIDHQWAAIGGFATVIASCVGILVVVSLAVGRPFEESPFVQLLVAGLGDDLGRALAIFGVAFLVVFLALIAYALGPGRRRRAERDRMIDEAAHAEISARAAADAAREGKVAR